MTDSQYINGIPNTRKEKFCRFERMSNRGLLKYGRRKKKPSLKCERQTVFAILTTLNAQTRKCITHSSVCAFVIFWAALHAYRTQNDGIQS